MARTGYVFIPPGYEKLVRYGLHPGDRFTYPRMCRTNRFFSYPKMLDLRHRSLLPQIKIFWDMLDLFEKAYWGVCADVMNSTGYRLFVQDTIARIKLELPGYITPSEIHQSFAGMMHLEPPGNIIKLFQSHPKFYWVRRKITGTKSSYRMVQVTEVLTLPLELEIAYESTLIGVPGVGYARYYAVIRSLYQGRDIYTRVTCEMDLVASWNIISASIGSVLGQPIGYSLYLEMGNVTGDIFFDNIRAIHSGQNWVRDSACKDISVSFTRAFTQVPKHWAPIELPSGADYDSIYMGD